MQIVMLADVMRLCPTPDKITSDRLLEWFWLTTYTERFSGITGGQTNAILEGLRRVADGEPLESKSKERKPNLTLPVNFNPNWVRVKAVALRLAALNPMDLDGSAIDAGEQLASDGPNALVPIAPTLKGIAARMFTQTKSELRTQLACDAPNLSAEILESHAITLDAAKALVARDIPRFLELRGTEIRRLEQAFFVGMFPDVALE